MNHTTPPVQTSACTPAEALVISATPSYTLRRINLDTTRPTATRPPVAVPQMWQASREIQAQLTRVVALLLEVLDGRRPVGGVAVLVTPPVARYLRAGRTVQPGTASRLLSAVHVFTPRPGVAEVAAVCRINQKVRAVALRFELDTQPDDGPAWRVSALRVL